MQKLLEYTTQYYEWLASLLLYHKARNLAIKKISLKQFEEIVLDLYGQGSESDLKKVLSVTMDELEVWRWWQSKSLEPGTDKFEEYVIAILLLLDRVIIPVGNDAILDNTSKFVTESGNLILSKRRWWNSVSPEAYFESIDEVPMSMFSFLSMSLQTETQEVYEDTEVHKIVFSSIKKDIKIALCPMTKELKTAFEATSPAVRTSGRFLGFRTKDVGSLPQNNFHDYKKYLEETVQWALDSQVNILCFPEMSICEKGRTIIRTYLGNFDLSKYALSLILPGSFHTQDKQMAWKNSTPIWWVDGKQIKEIVNYYKTEVLTIKADEGAGEIVGNPSIEELIKIAHFQEITVVSEDIESDSNGVILETSIGRIGILICRDFLAENITLKKYRNAFLDHLFIISLNYKQSDWFLGKAQEWKRTHNCSVYYVNALQVLPVGTTFVPSNKEDNIYFFAPPRRGDMSKLGVCKTEAIEKGLVIEITNPLYEEYAEMS